MGDEYEDDSACQAFNRLFNTIKDLQKIENRVRYRNNSVLEQCKHEIENLFTIAASNTEKERGHRPKKVS